MIMKACLLALACLLAAASAEVFFQEKFTGEYASFALVAPSCGAASADQPDAPLFLEGL